VLRRLDTAFANFFEGRAKYPKFKKHGNYRSVTFPQIDASTIGRHSVVLPKIRRVRMVKHRPVKGKPKTLTVVRYPNGEWYAIITVELSEHGVREKPIVVHRPVGVDSGLINYLYLSDGTHVDNPNFMKQHEKRIKKAQSELSRKKRIEKTITTRTGEVKTVNAVSSNWLKAKTLLAKKWQDYVDAKDDWQWKLASHLVAKYDFIAYEDLQIQNMLRNHSLARAIQDAAWAGFWGKVENKAATADSTCITQKVPSRYTTQRCSRCGYRIQTALSERTYRCPNCSFVAPRDHNSALDISQDGLRASGLRYAQPIGVGIPEFTSAETEPLPPEPVMVASLVTEAGNKFHACGRTSDREEGTACMEAHELQPWENVTPASESIVRSRRRI
jgi:putative transposase